ncbi:arylesterase [Comamonas endophytica]|uniref:Arylesterase n=1 Tax=Comamonas endophytica TaxID=2949090 RepID=A0ABY6G9F6_9BURK|nr:MULTISPECIES: arylesterase [unclassified Acidovorax]MCD2511941.1 arylesterase [Acidovorax sp. D4N7]UYG51658.1 arylesterase [Acidovorax sp. 5MLIR]UYG51728.1 arylesterase [Acidovorax sp. 5MLIR]
MKLKAIDRRRWLLAAAAATACGNGIAAPAKSARPPVVLVVGDSLSAEYGLARGQGWVALLQQRLAKSMPDARVINASVSGDTTAGGRARLANLLRQHQPTVVVIELGGNDALRGLPVAGTRDNLLAMTRAAQAAGARVLLLGMQVPPNYGGAYGRDFSAVFPEVARQSKAALLPFLLTGIADVPDAAAWFQPDRIHPAARAHPRMLENVWPHLEPLLKQP